MGSCLVSQPMMGLLVLNVMPRGNARAGAADPPGAAPGWRDVLEGGLASGGERLRLRRQIAKGGDETGLEAARVAPAIEVGWRAARQQRQIEREHGARVVERERAVAPGHDMIGRPCAVGAQLAKIERM